MKSIFIVVNKQQQIVKRCITYDYAARIAALIGGTVEEVNYE